MHIHTYLEIFFEPTNEQDKCCQFEQIANTIFEDEARMVYPFAGIRLTYNIVVAIVGQEQDSVKNPRTVQYESNILFESVFKNNSNKEQHHSLKTEQQTTGTCTSSITKGYTTGFNVGLTLSAPADIAGTTCGFSKGFSVENTLANEDQRTMTWSAEGVLLVEKQSMLTAKLQITEKQSSILFTTNVAVKGEVIVTFYERKNNRYLMEYRAPIRTILVQKKDKFTDAKGEIFVEDIEWNSLCES
ncbi:unnamed protein product [Mytilus edulis]|uniref:Uncharacterized protein n=1 Tax=Mytilus edulis TaxID=6550 RepID=A0A8S3SKE0_MYTED|nr:unnamed protein product [Mytilus edulis]